MATFFTPAPLLDLETVQEFLEKAVLLSDPPRTLREAASPDAVWRVLNAVYPSWFDDSVHPKNSEGPEVRLFGRRERASCLRMEATSLPRAFLAACDFRFV